MRIAILQHDHRHGSTVYPFRVAEGVTEQMLPRLDNDTLRELGVQDPELERDDEFATWLPILDTATIPCLETSRGLESAGG